jgi:hypothetical protein
MNTSLIFIDGVLRKMTGGTLIPEGRRLYVSLSNTGRIVLAGLVHDREQLELWLELNGCVSHDFVFWCHGQSWAAVANTLRREGYDVDLVVVPDPNEAQQLIKVGFNTLLFTHAEYAHPDWRPDAPRGVQAWIEITDRVAAEARAKAKDTRVRNEDTP